MSRSKITIEQVTISTYVVLYDNDVTLGQISKHNSEYYFYPKDIDGISHYTLTVIINKIQRIKEESNSSVIFSDLIQTHTTTVPKRKKPKFITTSHASLVAQLRQEIVNIGLIPRPIEYYSNWSTFELRKHLPLIQKSVEFSKQQKL